ncbi:MAG: DUF6122 family protein [Polaribacter sp.]|nr:DUF6122 family protein [Polaribacter sp.]MDG2151691.1 DUF6122 family protein [Polaribacter sp.]
MVFLFFKKKWKTVYFIYISSILVDLIHLMVTPII